MCSCLLLRLLCLDYGPSVGVLAVVGTGRLVRQRQCQYVSLEKVENLSFSIYPFFSVFTANLCTTNSNRVSENFVRVLRVCLLNQKHTSLYYSHSFKKKNKNTRLLSGAFFKRNIFATSLVRHPCARKP